MNRRLSKLGWVGLGVWSLVTLGCATGAGGLADQDGPPEVEREFRAVWIATVANIDWPSKPGLTTQQQQDELLALLDTAEAMNLNAVIFQVRTSTDALYDSKIEPWSAYLTGKQGQAPDPAWDPLTFAIEQSRLRGLELHAWINPLRSQHPSYDGDLDPTHVSKTLPQAVPQYGNMLWMDPGHPATLRHTLRVVEDLVSRYDIDGLHIDDYFYPYPQRKDGKAIEFPDDATFNAYQSNGGKLSRNDWRRKNVDRMIHQMHRAIKKTKPHVKFGISPFGIWRPGFPEYVKGMDQYDVIFADAKKWLEKGWCDYFTPQLYWPIENPDQSFTGLLQWWMQQNPRGRHLWPGMYTSRTGDGSKKAFDDKEVFYQVRWSRILLPEAEPGHVHFSMKAFSENRVGITDTLSKGVYASKAVTPEMDWLRGETRLRKPQLKSLRQEADGVKLELKPSTLKGVRWLAVQVRRGESWRQIVLPADGKTRAFELPTVTDADHELLIHVFDRLGHTTRPLQVTLKQDDEDRP